MPFGFVHLISAWLAGKGYEIIKKTILSNYTWLFLLFGSILPDIDHLVDWTLNIQIHRSFTHSLFFAVIAGLGIYLLFKLLKHQECTKYAFAISCGILTHVLLDMLSYPGIQLLWPSQLHFSITHIGYLAPQPSLFDLDLQPLLKLAIFDMGIGAAWLFYLALRKRIKF